MVKTYKIIRDIFFKNRQSFSVSYITKSKLSEKKLCKNELIDIHKEIKRKRWIMGWNFVFDSNEVSFIELQISEVLPKIEISKSKSKKRWWEIWKI